MQQLEYRLRRGENRITGTIVLYHGFGANADDLFSLADSLDPERRWNVFCPQAPVPLRYGSEIFGYAWFPETALELQDAMSGRYFRNLPELEPDGLETGVRMVLELVDALELETTRFVAGGFSQGAMMGVETALQYRVDALLVYSGALVAQQRLQDLSEQLRDVPVLQSHGASDSILSPDSAHALRKALSDAGARVRYYEFQGDHTIPFEIIERSRVFLHTQFSASGSGATDL
ncbi:MAG: alpha/beta hydrolase [Spirochaetaceae bacterium]